MSSKQKNTVSFEEFFNKLPPDEQRAIKARTAEAIAEYQAEIDADRAAGIVPPEDLPIDESIFSNEVKASHKP